MTVMKLLTPAQVGAQLGFSSRAVTRWCREGQFEKAEKIGRVWRIPSDDKVLRQMMKGEFISFDPRK